MGCKDFKQVIVIKFVFVYLTMWDVKISTYVWITNGTNVLP